MKRVLNILLILSLLCFTVIHFLILTLHAGPINPVYAKYRVPIEQYVNPLLTQHWNLFAPDPVEETQNILVQYRTSTNETSDWYNISKPLLEANQSNIISPYNKTARIPSSLYFSIFNKNTLVSKMEDNTSEEEFDKAIDMDKIKESRSKQVDLLYRFANSNIPLITNTDEEVEEVKVKIMNVNAIPFSERNNTDYEPTIEEIEFEWREYFPVLPLS